MAQKARYRLNAPPNKVPTPAQASVRIARTSHMKLSSWLNLVTVLLQVSLALRLLWHQRPSAVAKLQQTLCQTHRPLAEAELNRLYKERFHESLQLDGTRRIWEQENSAPGYELIVILQNREGEYLWFRYINDAPALLKPTTAAIVKRLTQCQHAPTPLSTTPLSPTPQPIENRIWNLSK